MADCMDLWVEVFADHALVRIAGDPKHVRVPFSVPVDHADLSTLTSPLVFKQTAGNAESDFARDIGMRLFGAVFAGEAARLYANAVGTDDQGITGVRLHIVAASPDLQALPWELLYDRAIKRDFVALVPGFTIGRRTHRGPSPHTALATQPGVLIVGDPTHAQPFVPSSAAVSYQERGSAPDEFPHVVHVLGKQPVSLAGRPPLLLILDGAATDQAAAFHAKKVPAVLGFRTPSTDTVRATFLTELYGALGKHGRVESAVAKARAAVDLSEPGRPDWSFSVLYQNGTEAPRIRLTSRSSQPAQSSAQRLKTPIPLRPDLRAEAEYLATMIQLKRTNLATLRDRWPDHSLKAMPEPVRRQLKDLLTTLKRDRDRLKDIT
ncbi:hypothetical protein DMH04_08720 [Kibdelosporangium aridum]|uniref:Uncharacterized protein n=1 Tax=Kibdelosporangium aridum TaxID=2030 RepID=A0A428ZKV3_KIBAR|nr:hypothetical protein [Kibdelosporangium aridum]RSM88693.1 hypothetical protein DMH04_08720 [Kibdelosporangium aridum]